MARRVKAKNGEPMAYLLAHMNDGCCYDWPYAKQSAGYPHLFQNGKTTLVSRIVCSIHCGDPPVPKSVVRHKCGKGHLGCFNAECLEWGTSKQNTHDAIVHGTLARGERVGTSKLKEEQVKEIKELHTALSQAKVAEMYDVSQTIIWKIRNGKVWNDQGN